MPGENKIYPFNKLNGLRFKGFSLQVGEVKQLRFSGWKGFKLYLQNAAGRLSTLPVVKGIFSVGGKEGVKPWMDIEYREELQFPEPEEKVLTIVLSQNEQDRLLVKRLGGLIPPGGHLMVSYEGDQKIHLETIKSLSISIPPAATALGYLIFLAGFQYIKDWYLAEGGFEGPRKLWGEKAPDRAWTKNFYEKTAQQMMDYLERKPTSFHDLEESARRRAREVLKIAEKHLQFLNNGFLDLS
jgi:hypothetical protein